MTKSVQQKISDGDYDSKLPLATRTDFTVYHVYNKGVVIHAAMPANKNVGVYNMLEDWKKKGYTVDNSVDDVGYKAARQAYNLDVQRLRAVFEADLAAENGITNHPMVDKVYQLAREYRGDSLRETADAYDDFAQLLR